MPDATIQQCALIAAFALTGLGQLVLFGSVAAGHLSADNDTPPAAIEPSTTKQPQAQTASPAPTKLAPTPNTPSSPSQPPPKAEPAPKTEPQPSKPAPAAAAEPTPEAPKKNQLQAQVSATVCIDQDCMPLNAAPLVLTGDTSDPKERLISRYSCKPTAQENGAEIWYKINTTTRGKLVARLLKAKRNIDLDLHLLSSKDGESCIHRADRRLVKTLPPGQYWLVIDSWQPPKAKPKEGPYRLELSLTPK